MKNREIAKIFYEIAKFLEAEGVLFKPYAYQKGALSLEALQEDVGEIYRKGGMKALMDIPGIGKSLAEHIKEYILTGKIKEYEKLKKKLPINLEELTKVEGVGPKKAKVLFEKLGIRNVKDLERAARLHKIAPLFGFGEKTEKNILQAISFLKKSKGRFLLGEILPFAKELVDQLRQLKEVEKISLAGSLRRMKETIGDVDILVVSSNPERVMDFFVNLKGIEKVWGKGKTKTSVRVAQGFDIDLRIIPRQSYGAALQYFTGNKEHNILTRKIALEKGLKLSEYGLFRGKKMIAGENEEDIYAALGLPWIPPELRENEGEIEAALNQSQGKGFGLPRLIDYKDIKGDLHCHSDWDGGVDSIDELVETAIKMGYEYLGIADHTKFLKIERGLDERALLKQHSEIQKINQSLKKRGVNFYVLHGCEANILNNGAIDIKDEVLRELDYVIAGIHSSFKMSSKEMTERLIRAMKNPNVDIISHPTGRLINKRDEYQINLDKILKVAKETKTILEINSFPERLDLRDVYVRRAKSEGVKMVINTDAHQKEQLSFIEYGIATARRGWAERDDIINVHPLEELRSYFK